MDNFLSLLYSVIGGVIVGVFDFLFLRKQGELEKRVQHLETEKFAKLENKVEEHIEKDRSQEILNELKHLSGSVTRMADKIDGINRNDAEQKTKLENHDLYLKNMNDIVTAHINNHKK